MLTQLKKIQCSNTRSYNGRKSAKSMKPGDKKAVKITTIIGANILLLIAFSFAAKGEEISFDGIDTSRI